MNVCSIKICLMAGVLAACVLTGGCSEPAKEPQNVAAASKIEPGQTIGSLVEVFAPEYIPVSGYALVGELKGTGSAECPRHIRSYLTQYIRKHLPGENVERLINSRDTAVVLVEGSLPTAVEKGQYFDVRVSTLEGSQTTSLEGGQLYGAELRSAGRFTVATKVLADAEGPVYIDKIDQAGWDKRRGYVLGGARILDEYPINLALREPDYLVASAIRNTLIVRFGAQVSRAVSAGLVEVMVPAEYKERRNRFISIIRAMPIGLVPEAKGPRISASIAALVDGTDKEQAEITLEALGNDAIPELRLLLDSQDARLRLRAARCMLNLGDDEGLISLRQIAMDQGSAYRIEALEAICAGARRQDAAAAARRLLRDEDFEVRLAAYEQLRKLDDIAVTSELVGGKFHLDQIPVARHSAIFVSRSGEPRIALFGAPLHCRENLFVQSSDGSVTINALPGQKSVSIIRKVAHKPTIGPIKIESSFELSDIIRALGAEPVRKHMEERVGLDVCYAEIILLLKEMVDKGAVKAEFRAGPLPQIGLK